MLFLGEFLDILAVSCDSFNEETNLQIGRHQNGKDHLRSLSNARDWCRKYHVAFKINTVVNSFNVEEDMNHKIQELAPVRWKVSKGTLGKDAESSIHSAKCLSLNQQAHNKRHS